MGYDAFSIPKLSPVEINWLIEGYNLEQKEKQKSMRKRRRK